MKKEFKEINCRGFIVAAFTSPYSSITNKPAVFLTAMTNLKKRTLYFNAECGAKNTAGFIDNMYKSLLSVCIKEK